MGTWLALLATVAAQSDPNLAPIETTAPDCTPQPLAGTVQQDVVQQSRDTNAQLYGAVSFAERVLFPRTEGHYETDRDGYPVWAIEVSVLNGVAFVPSVETGCEFEHLNHRVDLYGSASGLSFNVGPLNVFYAGSLTGHMYAKGVASGFAPYGYGLGTALGGPLVTVPLTYVDLGADDGTTSVSGDYMVGAALDVFGEGFARVAYVGSSGLYTNVTGSRVRLFAAAALDDFTELSYFRGGLDKQLVDEVLGYSSLYLRQKELSAAGGEDASGEVVTALDDGSLRQRTFRTGHVAQEDLFGVLDLDFAYALAPDLFVHDARIGLHTPIYGMGKRALSSGEGMYAFEEAAGDASSIWRVPLSVSIGQVKLPELPYWGVDGGQKVSVEVEAFMLFPSSDSGGLMILYTFKANDPETLSNFPYAQDALAHYFTIQLF